MPSFSAAWKTFFTFLVTPIHLPPKRERLLKFISIAMVAGLVMGSNLLPFTGFDWYCCWQDYVHYPTTNHFPGWIFLVISPIASLPNPWHMFNIFNGIVMAGVILLADFAAPWAILTLPVVWIFYFGQIDHWVALGAVLGLYALKKNNATLGGAAALLLMAKPHLGAALALFYLWKFRGWKMLILPGAVLLVSFGVFGFWPLPYVQTLMTKEMSRLMVDRGNISLFPWSLALVPLCALYWKKLSPQRQAVVIYGVTCLVLPYCPSYSVLPLLFMVNAPLVTLLLIPAFLGYQFATIFGAVFVLACLALALFRRTSDSSVDQPVEELQSSPV